MCGVFGFIANDGATVRISRLEQVATSTESRGPHAFGFAWIDSNNRLRMFKSAGPITRNLGLLSMMTDARMLIGHCRYATHGTPQNNLNNHPHSCDGGWIVHNGVIHRYDEIVHQNGLMPVTDCDSEVVSLLIEECDGSLLDRVVKAAAECVESPFAMLGIWKGPETMVAVRGSNPLQVGHDDRGTWLASLPHGIPNVRPMPAYTAAMFRRRGGKLVTEKRSIPHTEQKLLWRSQDPLWLRSARANETAR